MFGITTIWIGCSLMVSEGANVEALYIPGIGAAGRCDFISVIGRAFGSAVFAGSDILLVG
jgi:hypothetical protein